MLNWLYDWFDGRTFGAARSSDWRRTQQTFITANPVCAFDGKPGTLINPLNVHHCEPFHLHPELENEWDNLITLCRFHHFWHGHLGSWRSHNSSVKSEAALLRSKIETRP